MLVSVIVPVYNKEMYLEEMLDSLIAQTYSEFECILIDDGSTDSSGAICDKYAGFDHRILVEHISNGGVSNARNVGINRSKGEYITFVDADDVLDEHYLERLVSTAVNEKVDLVIQSLYKFEEGKTNCSKIEYPIKTGRYCFDDIIPFFAEYQESSGIFGWCCGKLISKKLIGDARFNTEYTLAEDFDFYLQIYPRVKTVFIDNNAYYYYRTNAENSSVRIDDYKINYLNQLKIYVSYKRFLKNSNCFAGNNRHILEQRILNYVYFSIFYCELDRYDNVYDEVFKIYYEEELPDIKQPLLKRIVIKGLKLNRKAAVKRILIIYRLLRNTIRKITWKNC